MARIDAELFDLAVKEIDVLDELVDEDVVSLAESCKQVDRFKLSWSVKSVEGRIKG